ncbi:MAG TPA: AraC family transcriptional regulator [Lapillicoccus sp.]|nr:AraC family transcriptional regulator [Lapillicoccus sp.]
MSSDDPPQRPWFRAVAVADDLTDRLALAWVVDTDVAHDLVPDAHVDVVWLPDGTVVVCGPEVEGWTFQPLDGDQAVGVRFRPGHATPVLGTAMDEIRDQRVRVEELLGADGRRLVEELADLPDGTPPERRIAVVEEHIRRWVADGGDVDPAVDRVAVSLADDPSRRVGSLRRELDLSERQLLRRCTVAFGYGPATLRRILRLQRFLELAGGTPTDGPVPGLAELAHQAGYADQQHLARDARAIARATPSELVAERRDG